MRRPPQLVSCHTLYNHGTAFLTVFSRQMLEIIFHFSETYEITLLYIYSWPPDIASFFHLYSLCGLSLKKKKQQKKNQHLSFVIALFVSMFIGALYKTQPLSTHYSYRNVVAVMLRTAVHMYYKQSLWELITLNIKTLKLSIHQLTSNHCWHIFWQLYSAKQWLGAKLVERWQSVFFSGSERVHRIKAAFKWVFVMLFDSKAFDTYF